jgi:hypothetical protein
VLLTCSVDLEELTSVELQLLLSHSFEEDQVELTTILGKCGFMERLEELTETKTLVDTTVVVALAATTGPTIGTNSHKLATLGTNRRGSKTRCQSRFTRPLTTGEEYEGAGFQGDVVGNEQGARERTLEGGG